MNKDINQTEEKTLLKKFLIYGGIFAVGIFIVIFNRVFDDVNRGKDPKEPEKSNKITDNETLKQLSEINDNFYSMTVHLTLDDDAITLDYQKIDTIEVGQKKYHKNQTQFIKANNIYYVMENNNFIKNENFIDFDFDKTFINLTNIKELLKSEGEFIEETKENQRKITYTYSLKDVIRIYNNFNKTSILVTNKGNIKLNAILNDNKLEYIEIDTTDLYNLIENTELSQVKYKITITKEKEEDPSWILEKLL